MILYLMRHGQTDWNAEEKVQGWNDTPLNETGAEQARAAAGKLSGEKIETIYASDFKRARKSADIISGILDLPVHYTKRLREMNFGKAEGLKKNDLEAVFPYIYQAFNDIKNPDVKWSGQPIFVLTTSPPTNADHTFPPDIMGASSTLSLPNRFFPTA